MERVGYDRAASPVSDQRVYDHKAREAIEVAIDRPHLPHAVLAAQGRDARVMDLRSGDSSPCENCSQRRPVVRRLGQEHQGWRPEPGVHLVESARQGRRRGVDAGMGDDGEKLVNTWPGDRPGRGPFCKFRNSLRGRIVKRRILAVSVDQDVGVDGDQPPRPS